MNSGKGIVATVGAGLIGTTANTSTPHENFSEIVNDKT